MAELEIEPVNRVRFAFWGAEEDGLIGSQYYVDHLPKRDLKDIALNLNHDMVGSPNFVRFVTTATARRSAATDRAAPVASSLSSSTTSPSQGLATEPTEFDGRSD